MHTNTLTAGPVLEPHCAVVPPITNNGQILSGPLATQPEAELPPDAREQLFNGGDVGPVGHIQVSTERIVKLRGILFDIDPHNLRGGALVPALSQDADVFYERCLRPWLSNHPVLEHLEVRASGTGLHAILWLDPPVTFYDDAARKQWCSIVKIVQAILPTDPMAPGITATTRAIGSLNTKCNRHVRRLKQGRPVTPAEVITLKDQLCGSPFRTVFQVLTGADRLSPCPFCAKATLVALDHAGVCYGCGKVSFERLCREVFESQKAAEA